MRRGIPNFLAIPRIVPPPCSYSRRICSNSSSLALLSTRPPLGRLSPKRSTRYLVFSKVGPNQSIERGQIRISKSNATDNVNPAKNRTFGSLFHDELLLYLSETPRHLRLLSPLGRPVGRFNAELLCVFRVQSLPGEFHRLRTNDASNGLTGQKPIQHIETNVPPGSTHRDEAVTDVGPQREARAANNGFEFPPHLKVTPLVLKQLGSIGSRHFCFGHVWRGCSHRGELHRVSHCTQASIGVEGSPLVQVRRVG